MSLKNQVFSLSLIVSFITVFSITGIFNLRDRIENIEQQLSEKS